MVPTERIPLWAAHWLVDSYDGEALRTLAGFSGRDPYEVHDVLPDALADCGTPIPDPDSVVWSGYAKSVISLPLGQLYTLANEWGAGWGRTEQ